MSKQRRRTARLILALLVALTFGAGLAAPVQATHELADLACVSILLPDDPGVHASTDGATVVWNSFDHQGQMDVQEYSILAARLDDRQPFEVARGDVLLDQADVDGDIVVWLAGAVGEADVHAKRLSTAEQFVVSDSAAEEQRPLVEGDWVVWYSVMDDTAAIMARDIGSMADPLTIVSGSVQDGISQLSWPQVDGGRVYWSVADDEGSSELYSAALGPDPEVVDEGLPGGQVSDGILVSEMALDEQGIAITVVDLATRASRTVTLAVGQHPSSGIAVTDGRYLFTGYITRIGGSTGSDFAMLTYDLLTDSWFPFINATNVSLHPEADAVAWVSGAPLGSRCIGAAHIRDIVPSARRSGPAGISGEVWYPETGHTLFGFRSFWEGSGGLPVFGYPLTEEFQELNPDTDAFYTTQYVERQRFEAHHENAGTPYNVLLGRLGAQLLELQGRDWRAFPTADPAAPHYFPETGHAIAPEFYGYWSSHGLEFGDEGVSFRESLALFGYPISEPMTETNADGDTVLTQYFERAVFEWHPENAGTPYEVLLRRVGAEVLMARGW
jgi:hypothetical protein